MSVPTYERRMQNALDALLVLRFPMDLAIMFQACVWCVEYRELVRRYRRARKGQHER